jgi:hypothetical protein
MIIAQNNFDPCSYQKDYATSINNLSFDKRDSLFSAIMIRDQKFRHRDVNPTYDFQNILELSVLIEKYGYPPKDSSSEDSYLIPTLACKHNPYIFNRYFYSKFKKYYESGVQDDDGYGRYLECLHLGKFGYWYIKVNRKENIKQSILTMQNRLKLDDEYALTDICNAYNKEILRYKQNTDSLKIIGQYENRSIVDGIDSIIIHRLSAENIFITMFKGHGINTYEMIKIKDKYVYKFSSDYNPMILTIGGDHIYMIDPKSKNKNVQIFNKTKNHGLPHK